MIILHLSSKEVEIGGRLFTIFANARMRGHQNKLLRDKLKQKEVVVHIVCLRTVEHLAGGGCGSGRFVYAQKETGKAWEKNTLKTAKCRDPFSYLGNSQPTGC